MPNKNTKAKQDDMMRTHDEAHHSDIKEKINKVLEKYDQGSNTRKWTGIYELIINLFLAAFAIYSVLINFVFHFDTRIIFYWCRSCFYISFISSKKKIGSYRKSYAMV